MLIKRRTDLDKFIEKKIYIYIYLRRKQIHIYIYKEGNKERKKKRCDMILLLKYT